ncbi:MAG: aldo/keto reductase [Anaerolineales bacterium]|nr:aldo/keto reductase [Anaerolineales bacterium]
MKTRPLGETGIEVSVMCLGTAYFGSKTDKATSYALLDQYLDAGGRFLDSANCYSSWVPGASGGDSERLIGEWMLERGNRDKVFVATKVGFAYPDADPGLAAWQIEAECEKSLQRLQTDHIDLYYAHLDDRVALLEETMEAFDRLVKAGKVRYIGASNYHAWRLEQAHWISQKHGWAQYCCVQNHYTYLRPKPGAEFSYWGVGNEELFDYCTARDLTILAYSTLLWGAYTRRDRRMWDKYSGTHNRARLSALRTLAAEIGATPNQLVLAWMMHSKPPVLPVIGVSKPEQLTENLKAAEIELTVEQMQRLNQA